MPQLQDVESAETLDGKRCRSMTLAEVMTTQREFDATYFTGANDDEGKRRHVAFHVGILAGKLLRIEERADHEALSDDLRSTIVDEVIPDLLVYAAQLASIADTSLDEAYRARHQNLRSRFADDATHTIAGMPPSVGSSDPAPSSGADLDAELAPLAERVAAAVENQDATDEELRSSLDAESIRLGYGSTVAHAVSNYAVSVRKLRGFAATCAPIDDVKREIRGVVSRELARAGH